MVDAEEEYLNTVHADLAKKFQAALDAALLRHREIETYLEREREEALQTARAAARVRMAEAEWTGRERGRQKEADMREAHAKEMREAVQQVIESTGRVGSMNAVSC